MVESLHKREHYLDVIRAILMLLGVPFHISLLYSSHTWAINAPEPSFWLTLLNDFIHSFRMQVFFVISGYFSYMLFLRYSPWQWLQLRLKRIGIPMLVAVPLLTLPQLLILMHWSPMYADWSAMTSFKKFNQISADLISHLWFLLTMCVLTLTAIGIFPLIRAVKFIKNKYVDFSWRKPWLIFVVCGLIWISFRRIVLIIYPALSGNALFHSMVLYALFYLPFFILGALMWKYPALKALFVRINPQIVLASALVFIVYLANQSWSHGEHWLYDLDGLISMQMGLLMTNVTFSLGYRFLNSPWPRISYLVDASLFIYLVHHPLTLLYGIFITPRIHSALLGSLLGIVLVLLGSLLLYEMHLRFPLLRALFSGKRVPSPV